jgi:hypothetical protein
MAIRDKNLLTSCGVAAVLMFMTACNGGTQVESASSGSGNKERPAKQTADVQSGPDKTGEITETAAIDFPLLGMRASGTTFCKEALPTNSTIETKLSDTKLDLKRVAVRVQCYKQSGPFGSGACNQGEFDQKINSESLGTTTFTRATKDELNAMKSDGKKAPSYAILATKVVNHRGQQYEFSRPLPVFPWPAALSRYEEIDGKEQKFSAEVTGEKNVSVEVAITMIDNTDSTATLEFVMTINGSEERSLYDKFPLPRRAVYTVSTEAKDIRQIETTDWFFDKECEHNGQVSLNYKLCSKTKSGKEETFPCD